MRSQGPVLLVADSDQPALAAALTARDYALMRVSWSEAIYAVARYAPIAVIALNPTARDLEGLAAVLSTQSPYLPMMVLEPRAALPFNVLPCSLIDDKFDYLAARLKAALRIRTLHATLLRRLSDRTGLSVKIPETDPLQEATVLLLGRGATYPALSVAFGEQLAVVGALSIEAAAKHLNTRDVNGIVLTEGFTSRVTDAFLTVLSEDARFRGLPVIVNAAPQGSYDLPNLEVASGPSQRVVTNSLPLIRQHAFEARLRRAITSIDANGLLDVGTGLLTAQAFARNLAATLAEVQQRNANVSIARFAFTPQPARVLLDASRIISRLMRQSDFGAVHEDESILVVFMEADLRTAQTIARRLASVVKHTSHNARGTGANPTLTITSLAPGDTSESVLRRLKQTDRRAAS